MFRFYYLVHLIESWNSATLCQKNNDAWWWVWCHFQWLTAMSKFQACVITLSDPTEFPCNLQWIIPASGICTLCKYEDDAILASTTTILIESNLEGPILFYHQHHNVCLPSLQCGWPPLRVFILPDRSRQHVMPYEMMLQHEWNFLS